MFYHSRDHDTACDIKLYGAAAGKKRAKNKQAVFFDGYFCISFSACQSHFVLFHTIQRGGDLGNKRLVYGACHAWLFHRYLFYDVPAIRWKDRCAADFYGCCICDIFMGIAQPILNLSC